MKRQHLTLWSAVAFAGFATLMLSARDASAEVIYAMGRDQGGNTSTLLQVQTSPFSSSTIGSSTLGRFSGLDFLPGTTNLFAASGGSGPNPASLFRINLQTGAATLIGSTGSGAVADLAIDNNGTIFGHNFGQLFTINPNTGGSTPVGALAITIEGLAVDPTTNILYGLDPFAGDLYRVNKTTAAETFLGSFGAPATGQYNGFGIDLVGRMFASGGGGSGNIYAFDPTTFTKTTLGQAFPTAVSDLAFVTPEPPAIAVWSLIGLVGFGLTFRRRRVACAVNG